MQTLHAATHRCFGRSPPDAWSTPPWAMVRQTSASAKARLSPRLGPAAARKRVTRSFRAITSPCSMRSPIRRTRWWDAFSNWRRASADNSPESRRRNLGANRSGKDESEADGVGGGQALADDEHGGDDAEHRDTDNAERRRERGDPADNIKPQRVGDSVAGDAGKQHADPCARTRVRKLKPAVEDEHSHCDDYERDDDLPGGEHKWGD